MPLINVSIKLAQRDDAVKFQSINLVFPKIVYEVFDRTLQFQETRVNAHNYEY